LEHQLQIKDDCNVNIDSHDRAICSFEDRSRAASTNEFVRAQPSFCSRSAWGWRYIAFLR
jgi:hypothetical protein